VKRTIIALVVIVLAAIVLGGALGILWERSKNSVVKVVSPRERKVQADSIANSFSNSAMVLQRKPNLTQADSIRLGNDQANAIFWRGISAAYDNILDKQITVKQ
jgi:hypothetical protein